MPSASSNKSSNHTINNNNNSAAVNNTSSSPVYTFSEVAKFKPADYEQALTLPPPNEGNYFGDSIQTFATTTSSSSSNAPTTNRVPHGKGVSISTDGQTRYGGFWNRGKRHGRGSFISPTLDYEGEWWEDAMHGNCYQMKYRSASGLWGALKSLRSQPREYSGEIHRDHGVHGRGKMLYSSGEIYEGEWYHGKKNGRGVQTTDEGERYDGQFENDVRHGTGVLALASGAQYLGMFNNGRRHGHGKMLRQNGDIYVGEFNQDEMQGNGVMTYKNGDTYSGEWKYNTRHGRGIFKLAEKGALVSGTFVSGLLQGDGTVEIPGKSIFIGEFLHGERVFGTMWLDGPSNKNTSNKKQQPIVTAMTPGVPPTPLPPVSSPSTSFNNTRTKSSENLNEDDKSNKSNKNNNLHNPLITRHSNPGAGGVYHGPFRGDGVHGKGLFWYPDGSFYCGEWFNGKRQGHGYMRHADGTEYSGEFFADERHGRGFLKLPPSKTTSASLSLVSISSSSSKRIHDQRQQQNHSNANLHPHYPIVACGIFDTDSSISVGYYGEWDPTKNELCGRGTFIEENGAVYEGLVQKSKREILGSISVPVVLERMDANQTNEEYHYQQENNNKDHKNDDKNTSSHGNNENHKKVNENSNNNEETKFKNWPNMVTAILSKYGADRSKALANFFLEMEECNSADYAEMLLKQQQLQDMHISTTTSSKTTDALRKQKNKNNNQQHDPSSKDNTNNNDDDDNDVDDNDDDDETDFSPERKFHHFAEFGPSGKKSTAAVHSIHLRIQGAASSLSCKVHSDSQLEPPSRRTLGVPVFPNNNNKNQRNIEENEEDEDDHEDPEEKEKENDDDSNNDDYDEDLNTTIGSTAATTSRYNKISSASSLRGTRKKRRQRHHQQQQQIVSCYIGGTGTTTTTTRKSYNLIYRGGFVADAAHGEGTLVLEDEDGNQLASYTGLFAGGEPCGNGIISGPFNSNRFFSGDWLRGRPSGVGVLYDRGTDITSPLPELPVQSSNAIMRLFTMRAHSQAEAEAARLAKLRRGIHRLPHIVVSDWYGGENHGETTVFFRSPQSQSSFSSSSKTLMKNTTSASNTTHHTTKIAKFSLLHGMPRLVFPHAPLEITSPPASAKPDTVCLLCGLAYGLLRVPVRCRCCARLGCSSCCNATKLAPHVPTVVLDDFTEPNQTQKVRHDDRMTAVKKMMLSQEHHVFDNFFNEKTSSSSSAHQNSSTMRDANAAALYNRSHLTSSATIAREKLAISARICEMCVCAIEEQLTKLTLYEEVDEEEMLALGKNRLKSYDDFDDADVDSSDDDDLENEEDDVDDENQDYQTSCARNTTRRENIKYYKKLASTKKQRQERILRGYVSGFVDKDGNWTDICNVWNRVLLNLCRNPRIVLHLLESSSAAIANQRNSNNDHENNNRNNNNSLLPPLPNISGSSPESSSRVGVLTQALASSASASATSPSSSSSLSSLIATVSNLLTSEISSSASSDVQYHGSMHNGKRNGFGTMILNYLDGEGYRGHWKKDLRDGEGIYRFPVHRCEEEEEGPSSCSSQQHHHRNQEDEKEYRHEEENNTKSMNNNDNNKNNSLPTIVCGTSISSSDKNNNNNNINKNNSSKNADKKNLTLESEATQSEVTSFVGVSGDWKGGKLIRLKYRGQINAQNWKAEGRGIGYLYENIFVEDSSSSSTENNNNSKNNNSQHQDHQQKQQLVEVYNGDWKNGQPHGVGIVTVLIPRGNNNNKNFNSNKNDGDNNNNRDHHQTTTYTHDYQQESQFIGYFRNGKRHGPGKSICPSTATITTGLWRDGRQEGRAQIVQSAHSTLFGVMHNGILEGPCWEQFAIPLDVSCSDLQECFESQLAALDSNKKTKNGNENNNNNNNNNNKVETSSSSSSLSNNTNKNETIINAGTLLRDEKGKSAVSSTINNNNNNQKTTGPTTKLVRRLLMFSNGEVHTESVTQADDDSLTDWKISSTTSCSFCGESFGFFSALWSTKYYCRCCARVGCGQCLTKYRPLPDHLNPVAPTKEENAQDFKIKQREHHQKKSQEENHDTMNTSSSDEFNNNNSNNSMKSKHLICNFCNDLLDSGIAFGALFFDDGLVYCGHIETKKSDCTLPHPLGFGMWFRSSRSNKNRSQEDDEEVDENDQENDNEQTRKPTSSSIEQRASSIYVCGSPFSWKSTSNTEVHSHQRREYNFHDFEDWWKQMLTSFNIDLCSTATSNSNNRNDDRQQQQQQQEAAMNYFKNTQEHDSITSVFYHSDCTLQTVLESSANERNDVPSSVKTQSLKIPNPKDIGVKMHQVSSSSSSSSFFTHKNKEALSMLRQVHQLKEAILRERLAVKEARRTQAKERKMKKGRQEEQTQQEQEQANNNNHTNNDDELEAFFRKEAKLKSRIEKRILMNEFLDKFLPTTTTTSSRDNNTSNSSSANNDANKSTSSPLIVPVVKLFELPAPPPHPDARPADPFPLTRDEVDIALRNARQHAADQLGLSSSSSSMVVFGGDNNNNTNSNHHHHHPTSIAHQQQLFSSFTLGPTPPPAPPLRTPFTSSQQWSDWRSSRPLPRNCLPKHLLMNHNNNNTNSAAHHHNRKSTTNNGDGSGNNHNGDDGEVNDDYYYSSEQNEGSTMFVDPHHELHNPFLLPASEGCLTSANASIVDSPNFAPPPVALLDNAHVPCLVPTTFVSSSSSNNVVVVSQKNRQEDATNQILDVHDNNSNGSEKKKSADENQSSAAATTTSAKNISRSSEMFGIRIIINHSNDGVGVPVAVNVVADVEEHHLDPHEIGDVANVLFLQ